ncbi:deacylase [Cellvibrio sp. KY-GH-1]|uniref:succinylglutamate desuccinylase/aspartoacylase family protein n=1 Tax=Cellvibrio sp. KY-GH-1 TaxID=2303332 RepID=UPI001248C822|nr:succinylglutamate desuccinylase/aspartoacylase family protein [Cellvibrio sp. KY-GH-1]QEY15443.1 deacylase [Cellvibrio sp. KY-GH-1]
MQRQFHISTAVKLFFCSFLAIGFFSSSVVIAQTNFSSSSQTAPSLLTANFAASSQARLITKSGTSVSGQEANVSAEPSVSEAISSSVVSSIMTDSIESVSVWSAVSSSSAASSSAESSVAALSVVSTVVDVRSSASNGDLTGAVSSGSEASAGAQASSQGAQISSESAQATSNVAPADSLTLSKFILDTEVKPNSSVRLTWNSDAAVGAFSEATPVLVVNGANPGKTLCLTAAVHGDELNGIEMIRRVIFEIDPAKLNGTIIGVPVANIMGFRRNSRYLPDRRDWNRYFPGNTHGSSASRLAHSFFSKIIMQCDALVDLHTGSFHRTNLPQLRADLGDENVARLAQSFGVIAVLNSRGNPNSLRAAAVRAGIPAVTLEAGEPMAMQSEVVEEGVTAINTLLAKTGMYGKQKRWNRIAPVYYRSTWVRANQSGILFSKATLGQRVKEGDLLGTVTDPITNARTTIKSPYQGRVIGMALDQVVLPGFAAYHIGIQTPEAILIEQSQMNGETLEPEEDEEDGDDSGVDPADEMDEPETGMSKAQDRMADE